MIKKDNYLIYKFLLLTGIVVVNIYPMSCATSVSPSVPVTQPTTVQVVVADYVKALQCIQSNPSITQADKDLVTAKISKLSVYNNPVIDEDITQYNNFKSMAKIYNCPNAF